MSLDKQHEVDSEGGDKRRQTDRQTGGLGVRGERGMKRDRRRRKERREPPLLLRSGRRRRKLPSKSASLLSTPRPSPAPPPRGASEATELRITNGRHWPGKKL